ncbi:MAG: hypothetical protein N2255_03260 [Kiritimatiellae bacterium]|nr:hypothetical protein [Kiritimatiellia bacterium]
MKFSGILVSGKGVLLLYPVVRIGLALLTSGLAIRPREVLAEERGKNETPERIVARKLQEIVIPELECKQADIRVVLRLLADLSRELDPEKRGVNIVCGVGCAVAREASQGDPRGGLPDIQPDLPLATFSARHISLGDALKIVCQLGGLKYRIEGSVVLVLPRNAPDGPIIVRWYNVLPVIEEKIEALTRERLRGPLN